MDYEQRVGPELGGLSYRYVLPIAIGWLDLCILNNSLGCAMAEPTLQILTFGQRRFQSRKHGAADYLLLPSQMIVKQLVSSDVAGVHAGHGVVHQELGIDL